MAIPFLSALGGIGSGIAGAGKAAMGAVGSGVGKIGSNLGSWASGGFGFGGGGGEGVAAGGSGGGFLGDSNLLGRFGQALFGGGNKALENTAMAYRRAYEGMTPLLDDARARFEPYAEQGRMANPMIASLLGMGENPGTSGAEGLARFRDSTGYQDTMSAALGGVGTNAAARGLLDSSGTGRVFQNTAGQIAQSSFGDFLNRLTGQQNVGVNAAGSQAEIDLGQASAKQKSLFSEHATRGQKKSSFLSKLFG